MRILVLSLTFVLLLPGAVVAAKRQSGIETPDPGAPSPSSPHASRELSSTEDTPADTSVPGQPAAEQAHPPPATTPTPDVVEPKPKPSPAEYPESADADAAALITVLASGVEVTTIRDDSLPVAAVVHAIGTGMRDDPEALHGLIHALAYHLQMGTRELAPGAAIGAATDAGGWAGMAVGPAQVRFESLVPLSRLDAVLRAESLRLRRPTVSPVLWAKSLSYAKNDRDGNDKSAREITAAAWNDPRLVHDGRKVDKKLAALEPTALRAHLRNFFHYGRSRLIVVGPESPEALLTRVTAHFDDLRPSKHIDTASEPPSPRLESPLEPRPAELSRHRGQTLVWPVATNAPSRAWARTLCETLKLQKAHPKHKSSKLRCTFVDEGRRPTLHLRASGKLDVVELAQRRLARITNGKDAGLLAAQRTQMAKRIQYNTRTPLDLAIAVARGGLVQRPARGQILRPSLHQITGTESLRKAAGLLQAAPFLLDVGAAVRPHAPKKPSPSTPASDTDLQ